MSPLSVSNVELGVVLLFACALMVLYGYLFFRLDAHIRRKGYQSPFRAFLLIVTYGAMVIIGFAYDMRDPESCWQCTPAANPEFFRPELIEIHVRRFVVNFSTATTSVLGATALAAWLVPRRRRRGGHRRVRFPWKIVGRVSLAGVPMSVALGIAGYLEWQQVFRIGVLCSGAHASCLYLARRAQSKPLEEVLQEDSRSPVLYLRAFDREDDYFTAPKNDQCRELGIPIRNPSAFRQTATLEEFLAGEISTAIGPFVALGDPHDYLPPAGAVRTYVDDDEWKDAFVALAHDSACILMVLGRSENLRWELRTLLTRGWQTKLFALTSPPTAGRWYSIQWGRSVKRQWAPFARELAECGFVAREYPGDGAVVGFDDHGRAVVAAAGCRTPGDYVSAIKQILPRNSPAAALRQVGGTHAVQSGIAK